MFVYRTGTHIFANSYNGGYMGLYTRSNLLRLSTLPKDMFLCIWSPSHFLHFLNNNEYSPLSPSTYRVLFTFFCFLASHMPGWSNASGYPIVGLHAAHELAKDRNAVITSFSLSGCLTVQSAKKVRVVSMPAASKYYTAVDCTMNICLTHNRILLHSSTNSQHMA